MYFGGVVAMLSLIAWNPLMNPILLIGLGLLFLIPGGIDGTTQMFGTRESTNTLRVITGLLLGTGIVLNANGVVRLLLG